MSTSASNLPHRSMPSSLPRAPLPISTLRNSVRQAIHGMTVPLALLLIWEILSRAGLFSPVVLPAPSAVAAKAWAGMMPAQAWSTLETADSSFFDWLHWCLSGELLHDATASLYRVVIGFAVGAGMALPFGLAMGASDKIYTWLNPLVQVLRPIPPIAYIPLAILWFGLGNPPAIFLIALGAFFPVLMNTIAGVRQVDGIYVRAARNLGVPQWMMFTRVILPAATPYILAGVRIGIGTAFIVVIVSEMIAVNDGLGFRILESREFMWSDKIIAGMLTIGFLGLAIDTAVSSLNKHLLRWHRGLDH